MTEYEERVKLLFKYDHETKSLGRLYQLINGIKDFEFHMSSPNKKDHQFNINIHKNDLILIDLLAEHLNLKRSDVIGTLMASWVVKLFNYMPDKDPYTLAKIVDKKLSELGSSKNHYQGKTWEWQISHVYDELIAMQPEAATSYLKKKNENNDE
jgi:hypothetical protein